jgi:hypothetical protein
MVPLIIQATRVGLFFLESKHTPATPGSLVLHFCSSQSFSEF